MPTGQSKAMWQCRLRKQFYLQKNLILVPESKLCVCIIGGQVQIWLVSNGKCSLKAAVPETYHFKRPAFITLNYIHIALITLNYMHILSQKCQKLRLRACFVAKITITCIFCRENYNYALWWAGSAYKIQWWAG